MNIVKGLDAMKQGAGSEFRTVRGYQQLSREGGQLTPALEDYLEMVYRSCGVSHYTRVGKIAELLNVTPSSASKMIFKLANLGFLEYEQREIIFLTDKGREIGAFLLDRHNVVDRFLQMIGVADSLEETELIEHTLTASTVGRLKLLVDFFRANPAAQKEFGEFRERTEKPPDIKNPHAG